MVFGLHRPVANARLTASGITDVPATSVVSASPFATDWGAPVILGLIVSGGAADETLIVRTEGAAWELFRVAVPANSTVVVKLPFAYSAFDGLEVATASAAGDVRAMFLYYQPGAKGLGS